MRTLPLSARPSTYPRQQVSLSRRLILASRQEPGGVEVAKVFEAADRGDCSPRKKPGLHTLRFRMSTSEPAITATPAPREPKCRHYRPTRAHPGARKHSVYETEGHWFESSRARDQHKRPPALSTRSGRANVDRSRRPRCRPRTHRLQQVRPTKDSIRFFGVPRQLPEPASGVEDEHRGKADRYRGDRFLPIVVLVARASGFKELYRRQHPRPRD